MTNQQLAETCRDILAEADKHEPRYVRIAKALMPCLEADPVAWATMQPNIDEDERTVFTKKDLAERYSKICYDLTPLYPAPPLPELKFPEEKFCPAEYAGSLLWSESEQWNKCIDEVKRLNGVKS